MIIELTKKWVGPRGQELQPGDKIDVLRRIYKELLAEDLCLPVKGDIKKTVKKTKSKKIEDGTDS